MWIGTNLYHIAIKIKVKRSFGNDKRKVERSFEIEWLMKYSLVSLISL